MLGQWRTNAQGETNDAGSYATRGYLGDYEVTVKSGGKQKAVKTSLAATGAQLSIVL